jgi:2-phosphosulfolactate phosphatase
MAPISALSILLAASSSRMAALAHRFGEVLRQCSSGKELIERGFSEDVSLASKLNVSDSAPILIDDAFVSA